MVSKKRKFLDNYIDRYILCYHFRDVTTILVLFFNLLKTTLQMGLDKEITRTEFHDSTTAPPVLAMISKVTLLPRSNGNQK